MQFPIVRTLGVCGACVVAASTVQMEVAVFPLLITAMTSHVRGRAELARAATQLLSQVLIAAAAASISPLAVQLFGVWQGVSSAVFLAGFLVLLSIQFTRLRHPPAMASGGAVLCGVDPVAVVVCVAIAGLAMLAEPIVLRALTGGLSEFLCSRLRVGSIDSDEPAPHITRQAV